MKRVSIKDVVILGVLRLRPGVDTPERRELLRRLSRRVRKLVNIK